MKLLEFVTAPLTDFFIDLLTEGKKADWIAANQGEKLVAAVNKHNDKAMHGKSAQELADYIEQQGGKYAQYYSKLYLKNEVKKMEDFYRLKPLIDSFNKNRRHLTNKDIMSYSHAGLEKALAPFAGKVSHKRVNPVEDEKFYKKGHMTKHVDSPNFEVIVPHTQEASNHLGKGKECKWCTAEPEEEHNRFHDHNDQGDLYVIRAGDRRYQLHYETDQFMDEKDAPVSKEDIEYLSGFPQYKQFLDMMIKKHYFEHDILKNDYKDQEAAKGQ